MRSDCSTTKGACFWRDKVGRTAQAAGGNNLGYDRIVRE